VNQTIAKYIKKNVLLIALVILCGFILSLCSAGSDSELSIESSTTDSNQKQEESSIEIDSLFSEDPDFTGSPGFDNSELLYKTILAVLLVIVMGIAAIFLTKKFLPKLTNISGKEIRIIETVHLGSRKSVHLLEIGKRRLLIGSTYENISKLADLTEFSSDMSILENEK